MESISAGEVYKWIDSHGQIHYSDKPGGVHNEIMPIEKPPSSQGIEEVERKLQALTKRLDYGDKREIEIHKSADPKWVELNNNYPAIEWAKSGNLEKQCYTLFELDCNELMHWKEYGVNHCLAQHGSKDDCTNDSYIADRYKPRSISDRIGFGQHSRSMRSR